MSAYNNIYEKCILPLSDYYTGWGISSALSFLNKSQWWSVDDLRSFQEKRLILLIDHAYNNVPYYKELFDTNGIDPNSITTIDDLKRIPLLTKELIVENFNNGKLIAKNIKESQFILKQSSGSTGLKTVFYINKEAYGFNIACNLRGWGWMGYRLGDRILKVSQNERHSFVKKAQDYVDKTELFSQNYSKENIRLFYDSLVSFKPKYLRSYPDPLVFLCSHVNKDKLIFPPINAINTTGNILFTETRKIIEDTFSCKVFDSYSCEGGANFFECQTHESYHVAMEYAIAEILNSFGKEVRPGESGNHVTTDLWNFASPFIRYDCKDIVEKSEHICSCGRGLMSVSKIIGRDNDILISPNGEYLIAQSFTTYFKYFPSILQFQVYQDDLHHIEFRFKINDDYNSEIQNEILLHWKKQFGNTVNISFSILDNIPPLPSGKSRFLIRNKLIELGI